MLRVKIYDPAEQDGDIITYVQGKTFINLMQDRDLFLEEGEVLEPPFRDELSAIFIQEIDGAEFVEDDWYSIVTKLGRTCLTALSGGTQYALSVIEHSSRGYYTTFEDYGKDIFGRLAGLPVDIRIAVSVYDVDPLCGTVPFVLEKFYYENGGYMVEKPLAELPGQIYDWREHIQDFIRIAEKMLENERLYEYPPIVYQDVSEFSAELRGGQPEDVSGGNKLRLNNYLTKVWNHIYKYPLIIKMQLRGDGRVELSGVYCVKYPELNEVIDSCMPFEGESIHIIIDAEIWQDRDRTFCQAKNLLKYKDGELSFYDGLRVYQEFLKFIKGRETVNKEGEDVYDGN